MQIHCSLCRASCPLEDIIQKLTYLYSLFFGEWNHQQHTCHPPSAFEEHAYEHFLQEGN